ncbi:uncharacterized protein LOC117292671 isoform X1 [Asterias rubens]|uniref:uncharacterized protein LOC117292671 isoform X1 n=1 Tax=Asterias rubens TaxID=7604 RepID=UPI001455CD59|nr:uncharacterized protein LOC117292671 isoform X1 [Asterias rubens]
MQKMKLPPMCAWFCLSIIINIGISSAKGSPKWESCIDVVRGRESFYLPEEESCCQGRILRNTIGISEECCGGQLYNSNTGKCCGGEEWYNDASQDCCDDTVFDLDGQTECCGGQVIDTSITALIPRTCCGDHPVAGTGECCGVNAVYDSQTELCCEGLDGVGHVHTIGRTEVLSRWMQCCGVETIDTRVQHCCNEVPRPKNDFSECCGPETFDVTTQICCVDRFADGVDYKISPLVEGRTECCGLEPINTDNEQCCESKITYNIGDGLCCASHAYNPQRSSCCYNDYSSFNVTLNVPEIVDLQGCCSGQSFLKTDQVCCSGSLYDKQSGHDCCGTELYNTLGQLCCEGNRIDKTSPSSQCCGQHSYEADRQTCCFSHVLDVANGSCCMTGENTYEAYSSLHNQCCVKERRYTPSYGKVHSKDVRCCGTEELKESHLCRNDIGRQIAKEEPTHDRLCCKPRKCHTFDSQTQVCKEGRVTHQRDLTPGLRRCGGDMYSVEDKQCCKGNIQIKTRSFGGSPLLCCGTGTYSPEFQVCYNEKSYDIAEKYAEICRNQPYDNRSHECDPMYQLIRPIAERQQGLTEICGSSKADSGYYPYNPTKHDCCGDMLIGPGETCCNDERFQTPGTGVGEGQCCDGGDGFNPNTHTCCGGNIHSISDDHQCCGGQLLDPASTAEMCCNDRVMPVENGRTECTSGVAHRPTETVCDGVVYEEANGDCCGKVLMNTNQQICCQDKFLYDKATHGDTCCGKVAYDSSNPSEKCCSDTSLYHHANGFICCGNSLMDTFKDVCREVGYASYIFPRQSDLVDCTEGSYDPIRQTCCEGILYNFLGECCGSQVFREGEGLICCGNKMQYRMYGEKTICCGEEVRSSEKHTCCGDKGLAKTRRWETCCDGVVMRRRDCRQKKRKRIPSRLGPSNCGGQLYNASVQGCCNEVLFDSELFACIDSSLQPLCAGTPYDDSTMMCCAGEVHSLETTGCCNGTPYDLSSPNVCCNNVLHHVRNGACCGPNSTPYNLNRNLCCKDKLRKKKNRRSECCGEFAFNPNTDTCCDGKVTRDVPHGACCGNKAFDPAVKMCCPEQGKLFKRRPNTENLLSDSLCCAADMEYNTTAGTCVPKDCTVCKAPSSNKAWREHTTKTTLIRGTISQITQTDNHHLTIHLTRVSHLNLDKQSSDLEFRVTVPSQCGCEELVLNKAYIIMSDGVVEWNEDFDHLTLRPTDFLARAKDQLGRKIKHYVCKHKD